MIFHELAHQLVYVGDDSAFNESFATFVQQEGLREWRASGSRAAAGSRSGRARRCVCDARARSSRAFARGLRERRISRRDARSQSERDRGVPRALPAPSRHRGGTAMRATTRGSQSRSTTRDSCRSGSTIAGYPRLRGCSSTPGTTGRGFTGTFVPSRGCRRTSVRSRSTHGCRRCLLSAKRK